MLRRAASAPLMIYTQKPLNFSTPVFLCVCVKYPQCVRIRFGSIEKAKKLFLNKVNIKDIFAGNFTVSKYIVICVHFIISIIIIIIIIKITFASVLRLILKASLDAEEKFV